MHWLVTPEVLNRMRMARERGWAPSLEERARFAAAMQEAYARDPKVAGPRNLKVAGNVAQINIEGVLTEKPDCIAMIFGDGNTTYASIREALATADADPAVSSIVLNVDSPGGQVHGLFETLAALEATKKPIRSRASLAASAAFAICAAAGPIEAVTHASQFGSIGVAASLYLDENVLDLASTEAPNKRPDVSTEAGQSVIREELDALHAVFVDSIARGRTHATGTEGEEAFNAARVNSEFGRGSVLLAKEAKKRGMIDAFPKTLARPPRGKNASAEDGGATQEEIQMDLNTLKAQHPAVYAAAFEEGKTAGIAEGEKTGETKERKRMKAHVKMAKAAGAPELALEHIESGASVQDDEVFAAYQTASMNRQAQGNRQADSDGAGKVLGNPPAPTPAPGAVDDSDLVASAMGLSTAVKKPAA